MGKESRGSCQQPPVAIAGGSGVVDVADGGQGADQNQRHDLQNHRGGRGVESHRDVGRIHERASVGDGRHVDKTEIPQDKNLEVDIPKSHDNGDQRMIRGGVSDPKIKTERSNQLLDKEELFVKATKGFTAQLRRREEAAAGRETSVGGRIRTTMPWHETPRRRKRGFFFLFWYNRAPREGKEAGTKPSMATGAASPWFNGEGSKTC